MARSLFLQVSKQDSKQLSLRSSHFLLFVEVNPRFNFRMHSEQIGMSTRELLWEKTANFALQWARERQGSARDFVREIESELGWPVRFHLIDVLDSLRRQKTLTDPERKFLIHTLSSPTVVEALNEGLAQQTPYQSTIDDLFCRSQQFRSSQKFAEAVEFLSRFKEYSPFNNMLVYLQNPFSTYFATANHWRRNFGRTVKEEARPMIILAPRTPVLMVYDIDDTTGPRLPEKLECFCQATGRFNPVALDYTAKNCERDQISIQRVPMGQLRAGLATKRVYQGKHQIRIAIREDLNQASAYSVLCHELAHVYLGHLGVLRGADWPYRLNLSNEIAEIEAETTAYIVCRRAGLELRSPEYLSSFMEDEKNRSAISLDLITRVAGRIEEMGKRLLAPRTKKAEAVTLNSDEKDVPRCSG